MTRRSPVDRPLLTVPEAAALLGVSKATLYRAVRNGTFPGPVVTFNGTPRIARAVIERMVTGNDPRPDVGAEEGRHVAYARQSASSAPMCSAARRSSSSMPSV